MLTAREAAVFELLFKRPLMAMLTLAGAAIFAPVVFPVLGVILKPLVRPMTNLYLDLTDEMADAFEERQERKGCIDPGVDREELKKLLERVAEDNLITSEKEAVKRLLEKI